MQPLLARVLLPWFGGSAAVWTTCLVFFQAGLVAGYAYAHLLRQRLPPRLQLGVHLSLCALACALLPIIPEASWQPRGDEDPSFSILSLLTLKVGLPYALLCASSPLAQHWYALSRRSPGGSPYRLYALSNAGSLLGLVSYPFAVEPLLDLGQQSGLWSSGFVLYALCCAACLRGLPHRDKTSLEAEASRRRRQPWPTWLALSATGSALLIACSNQLAEDLTVSPFLWVLPLALYLISYIIAFDSPDRGAPRLWLTLFLGALAVSIALRQPSVSAPIWLRLGGTAMLLLSGATLCHCRLARSRPDAEQLTFFYLAIASGGALGGAAVSLLAPRLLDGVWEFDLSLAAVLATTTAGLLKSPGLGPAQRRIYAQAGLALTLLVLLNMLSLRATLARRQVTVRRGFFGVLRVVDSGHPQRGLRKLRHGRITHGAEHKRPSERHRPTMYYGRQSGVGLALERHSKRASGAPLEVGVIGLGVGTLSCYIRRNDRARFYEIDPQVIELARRYFHFLEDCAGRVEVIVADGRLALDRESTNLAPRRFDLLVVDAFSGDAIPYHLLTREAFALYRRRLASGGVLALHLSNKHLDLWPVAYAGARDRGLEARLITSPANPTQGLAEARWALIAERSRPLEALLAGAPAEHRGAPPAQPFLWRDDRVELLPLIK